MSDEPAAKESTIDRVLRSMADPNIPGRSHRDMSDAERVEYRGRSLAVSMHARLTVVWRGDVATEAICWDKKLAAAMDGARWDAW